MLHGREVQVHMAVRNWRYRKRIWRLRSGVGTPNTDIPWILLAEAAVWECAAVKNGGVSPAGMTRCY